MSTALTPLPSLIRASSQDAGNFSMRRANRVKWNDDDWNVMCATQERLVRACFGKAYDHNQPTLCFIRFAIAERLERAGQLSLSMSADDIIEMVDQIMEQPITAAA